MGDQGRSAVDNPADGLYNPAMKPIPQSLIDRLSYNEATGDLVWKSGLLTGKIAGTICAAGDGTVRTTIRYRQDGVDENYQIGRIIWTMIHGPIPCGVVIDHINGNRRDNRLVNLRAATISQNSRNRGLAKNNSTGVHGVSRSSRKGKYEARIQSNGKVIHLGTFSSIEDARRCRLAAEQTVHKDFAPSVCRTESLITRSPKDCIKAVIANLRMSMDFHKRHSDSLGSQSHHGAYVAMAEAIALINTECSSILYPVEAQQKEPRHA